MKSLKMGMMTVLIILSISVFAQNNTTHSKKEQLKMEVMKIYTSPVKNHITGDMTVKNSKGGFISNLSSKQQMKLNILQGYTSTHDQAVTIDNTGTCPLCVTLLNTTPKEQMKMTVMELYNCPMNEDTATYQPAKCSMCGMDLTISKSR